MSAPSVDVLQEPDLVELLVRDPELLAVADAIAQTQAPRRRHGLFRLPGRAALLAASIALLAGAGTATAFAVKHLTQAPVTQGFSALDDPALPVAPDTPDLPPPARSVMGLFRGLGAGSYDAKQVGEGLYLARRGTDICGAAIHGFAGCTDHLDGDVWLQGDEIREYDAETAPFEIHFYGFARDSVAAIRVTTADGNAVTLPVKHNAFQATFKNTTFADIAAIEVVSTSGRTTAIDARKYFPSNPSTMTLLTPTSTTTTN
jgi:hypothetical protein